MMKIRCYDNKGRERWMAAGQVIPAGWYDKDTNLLSEDHMVKMKASDDNPYEQYNHKEYSLYLEKVD